MANSNADSLLIRYNLDGSGPYYISFYDEAGTTVLSALPTGIILNTSNGYLITDGTRTRKSTYLIASESGDLFGYNRNVGGGTKAFRIYAGSNARLVVPAYTGLTLTNRYLFVVNFKFGTIDVFNDTGAVNNISLNVQIIRYLPVYPNYTAPFNIVYLNNVLYVIYANKTRPISTRPAGGGFIDIHNEYGIYVKNFTSASLDSPWALLKAPPSLRCKHDDILVGNFGSGLINIYNASGDLVGNVYSKTPDAALVIDGLWGLFDPCDKLYFAAGPNSEANGLVGYLVGFPHEKCHHKKCYRENHCCGSFHD